MKKKTILFLTISVLLFAYWYLIRKDADYIITFKEKANAGTILQGIEEWNAAQAKSDNEKFEVTTKRLYKNLRTKVISKTDTLLYDWEILSENDSISKVILGVSNQNKSKSILNRLQIPLGISDFKTQEIAKVTNFRKGLSEHLQKFKVQFVGNAVSDEVFVAYISLESVMQEKAQTMIGNDNIITEFLYKNKINITGIPYVEVTEWNQQKERLKFNYCFPVDKNTPIIADNRVKFKTLKSIKGLKATYFGNFRTSDRAWFTILDQAKKQKLVLNQLPREHYLNNPFYGGNELEWKTEVFMPYKNQK
ncbi:MAG: hypothetical protein RLZZ312_423 [Bacteroidota bacterium]